MTAVAWRTSSYSGSNGGTCVEVAAVGWQAFTDQVRRGGRLRP